MVTIAVATIFSTFAALAEEPSVFISTDGFATKTGFRGVFTWSASERVTAEVHYGTSPTGLNQSVRAIPGAPDTSGLAITDGLTIGDTYYFQVQDLVSGQTSDVKSFKAATAYNAWDPIAGKYTLNLLVQLDLQALSGDIQFDLSARRLGISRWAPSLRNCRALRFNRARSYKAHTTRASERIVDAILQVEIGRLVRAAWRPERYLCTRRSRKV